jgi:hypothetical protein
MRTGQVFVSHTADMAAFPQDRSYVQAAMDAVTRAGMAPVDMQYFAARESRPADYCRRRVADCEIYVAVTGFRYGSLVPGEDVSFMELEFDAATAAGVPRLVFLLEDPRIQPPGMADTDRMAVEGFRQRLRDSGLIVRPFSSDQGLELEVFHALTELDRPARRRQPGWGGPGADSEDQLARVADQLAAAVGAQWSQEARVRRLNDPYPLPVSWAAADPALADNWAALERLATSGAGWPAPQPRGMWAAGPDGLAGTGGELADVLARVPTGRLVVLGEPGAGKTMLMVRLVLDLLARRSSGDPVPVLVSLASLDPSTQDLHQWLGAKLTTDYPALAAALPGGTGTGR